MSNPLAAFRKHQNVLLAVFGVLIMLSFAVGPIIQGCQQRSSGGPQVDAEVVSYHAGTITESELNSMRYSRQALRQYMATIGQIASSRGATVGGSFVPQRVDEASLVETRLMAEEARRLGIVIEKEEIVRFLKEYTGGQIKSAEFADLLKDVTGNRMSETQFFSAMRQHLLAARFGGLVQQGLAAATPSSMWDSFQRLNRRVEAEAVPYPVSDYLSSEPIPDARLREIYEEGKERFVDPSSSKPAFKRRKRVAVAYVKCVRDQYLADEKLSITEADIIEHYEANKAEFRNETLPPVGEMESSDESDFDLGSSSLDSDGDSGDAAVEDTDATDYADNSADDGTADDATADDATSDDATSNDATPDESGCGPQEPEVTDDDDSSEPTEDTDDVEPSETSDVDDDTDAADDESAEEDSSPNDEEDAEESAENDETDVNEATDEETVDETAADSDAQSDAPTTDSTEDDIANLPDEPAAPEFKPLDEVRDSIIETIAAKRAEPKFEQAKNLVESAMRDYFNDYIAWTVGADEEGSKQPEVIDLAALAAKHKFTAGSVPLVNGFELTEKDPVTGEPKYEISGAFEISPQNIVTFPQVIFDERLRKYETRRMRGMLSGSDFIYWKTDETEPKTPTFEECKQEVEAFAKRIDAAEKALEAAQKEATAIASTGKSLTEYFSGKSNVKVIDTGVFSWMTMLTQQQSPVVNEVPGIPYSRNDDFMQDVFSLEEGEYGVAMNGPKTVAYLVYLKNDVEPLETLRSLYARTGPTFDTLAVQRDDQMKRLGGSYNDFLESQQLKWLRQPRQ